MITITKAGQKASDHEYSFSWSKVISFRSWPREILLVLDWHMHGGSSAHYLRCCYQGDRRDVPAALAIQ